MSEPNRVLMGHPAWSLRGWWQWRRVTMRPARRTKPVTVSARHVARLIAYARHRRWTAEIDRTKRIGGPTEE
jgi:hypothetical protein